MEIDELEWHNRLKGMTKSQLIEVVKQRDMTTQAHIKKSKAAGKTIQLLQDQIIERKSDFDKRLNIKTNCKVFIEALSIKGIIRTYTGFVTKETKKHIKINISTKDGNYNYVISKDVIKGMKVYMYNKKAYEEHMRYEGMKDN